MKNIYICFVPCGCYACDITFRRLAQEVEEQTPTSTSDTAQAAEWVAFPPYALACKLFFHFAVAEKKSAAR